MFLENKPKTFTLLRKQCNCHFLNAHLYNYLEMTDYRLVTYFKIDYYENVLLLTDIYDHLQLFSLIKLSDNHQWIFIELVCIKIAYYRLHLREIFKDYFQQGLRTDRR